MQQIADWLKQLGMSEYAERFVESDIDTSVLRDLTDQDLKELGVSLGHRRKMPIANFLLMAREKAERRTSKQIEVLVPERVDDLQPLFCT